MMPDMQNPGGGIAGASRNQLVGRLHSPSTALDWQAPMLAAHFRPSPFVAGALALRVPEVAGLLRRVRR